MRKEDVNLLAQFLSSMKDAVAKLEEAQRRKDTEMFNSARQEILQYQWHIKKIL